MQLAASICVLTELAARQHKEAAHTQPEPAAQPDCMTRRQVRTCGQQIAARQHGQASHCCLVAMQGVLVKAPAKAPRLPHLVAILRLPAPAEGACRQEMVSGHMLHVYAHVGVPATSS